MQVRVEVQKIPEGLHSYYGPRFRVIYGGTTNKTFPKNLFPWAEIKRTIIGNEIYIDLPDCPAIQAQITASIKSAKRIEKNIIIPIAARSVLDAWERTVIG